MGPKQVPDNREHGEEFRDWQDYHSPDKSAEFHYSDSTKEHILEGESQKFRYEGNDLPEKG